MITKYVLIAALLVGSNAVCAERQVVLTNPVSGEGLRVIDSRSPSFSSEITKFLSSGAQTKAASFLPWSFIVINDTGRYVWGFTFIYVFPDNIAPAGTPREICISPSPGGPAPREFLLSPGSKYSITPVMGFDAATDSNGIRVEPILDDQTDRIIQAFQSQHPNIKERVEASVDSVIYEDGTIVGPDTAGTQARVNDMIQADQDLVTALEKLKGEDLRSHLAGMHPSERSNEPYSFRHDAVASTLQDIFGKEGEDGLRKRLQILKSNPWFPNSGYVRRKSE